MPKNYSCKNILLHGKNKIGVPYTIIIRENGGFSDGVEIIGFPSPNVRFTSTRIGKRCQVRAEDAAKIIVLEMKRNNEFERKVVQD